MSSFLFNNKDLTTAAVVRTAPSKGFFFSFFLQEKTEAIIWQGLRKLECLAMSMSITIDNVSALADDGLWRGELAPSAVQRLGSGEHTVGEKSVLLIVDPVYERDKHELRFKLENTTILNVGTSNQTIFLSTRGAIPASPIEGEATSDTVVDAIPQTSTVNYGPGDRKFLANLEELPEGMQHAGHELLSRIREKFPGDLKPYEQRRYINGPDNFWGVQIQTRKQMLKISVRGVPQRLPTTDLHVWLDRPPVYSAFKIEDVAQVVDAVQIIEHADRK